VAWSIPNRNAAPIGARQARPPITSPAGSGKPGPATLCPKLYVLHGVVNVTGGGHSRIRKPGHAQTEGERAIVAEHDAGAAHGELVATLQRELELRNQEIARLRSSSVRPLP
jgi:hypothetical protein